MGVARKSEGNASMTPLSDETETKKKERYRARLSPRKVARPSVLRKQNLVIGGIHFRR